MSNYSAHEALAMIQRLNSVLNPKKRISVVVSSSVSACEGLFIPGCVYEGWLYHDAETQCFRIIPKRVHNETGLRVNLDGSFVEDPWVWKFKNPLT